MKFENFSVFAREWIFAVPRKRSVMKAAQEIKAPIEVNWNSFSCLRIGNAVSYSPHDERADIKTGIAGN
jgi:hypothetical protein